MKEIRVLLKNYKKDKDGDMTFIAYAELFPLDTRVINYSLENVITDFVSCHQVFIFEHFDKFPNYQWKTDEISLPEDEHFDMFKINYIDRTDQVNEGNEIT
ncbi:hypothetical protein G7051_00565 [Dysgonomonas sp. HDW5B]|uniref:hypothetical protein n=1 Tax=Dysgonomonas sp. HDW5B TaxID=2714927 RepID=UPI0014088558|nr:hypothetical protein [Dysgonomonas sp. HDW5B]QIK52918.1 hypothetical protein G7051_00565 [Dysgonomonas sp. HDW5B]